MKCFLKAWVLANLLLVGLSVPVRAQIPKTLAFQGRLTNDSGQPLDGNQTVTFRLYDAATSGTKLWEETQTVAVSQGLFSVQLGSVTPLTLAFDQPYWVEVQVGTEALSPRQPLSSSPYALRADQISGISIVSGNVGIGTPTPGAVLDVSPSGTLTTDAFKINATDTRNAFQLKIQGHTGGSSHAQITTDQPNSRLSVMASSANDFAPRFQAVGPQDGAAVIRGWVLFDYGSALYNLPNAEFHIRHQGSGGIGDTVDMLRSVGRSKVILPTGNVGIGTDTPTQRLEVNGAARLAPVGRPTSPSSGTIYYDATAKHFYGFDGTTWKQLDN